MLCDVTTIVSGLQESDNDCSTGEMLVMEASGYLHYSATQPPFSRLHCPWLLLVRHGQQVKVTLFNFAATFVPSLDSASLTLTEGAAPVRGKKVSCPAYIVFREDGGRDEDVCVQSGARQLDVHVSTANELFVYVDVDTRVLTPGDDYVNFLLRFAGKVTATPCK